MISGPIPAGHPMVIATGGQADEQIGEQIGDLILLTSFSIALFLTQSIPIHSKAFKGILQMINGNQTVIPINLNRDNIKPRQDIN